MLVHLLETLSALRTLSIRVAKGDLYLEKCNANLQSQVKAISVHFLLRRMLLGVTSEASPDIATYCRSKATL